MMRTPQRFACTEHAATQNLITYPNPALAVQGKKRQGPPVRCLRFVRWERLTSLATIESSPPGSEYSVLVVERERRSRMRAGGGVSAGWDRETD